MRDAGRRAEAALCSVQGIGPVSIEAIERRFGSLAPLLELPVRKWAPRVCLQARAQEALGRVRTLATVADQLERRLRHLGYRLVFHGEPAWPPNLGRERARVLFLRGPGADTAPRRRVALVGTRYPEPGAFEWVRALAAELAEAGVGVISGAAVGIDRAAHLGALDGGGETWAFLGSAIDQMDPAQSALVGVFTEGEATFFSQFPPGARADRSSFTRRNPLIAGASDAVLVARAPVGSGALHTAAAALDLGRPLLVVPGEPGNPAAEASNTLLRGGRARVCLDVGDVLESLGLTGAVSRVPVARGAPPALTPGARAVLAVLRRHGCDVDHLRAASRMTADDVTAALCELELEGFVLQKGAGQWERVARAQRADSFIDGETTAN